MSTVQRHCRASQARIDHRIGEVDKEVDGNDGGDQQHDDAFDDDQVALGDRLEDRPAETGQVEDVLDDDGTGEQEGELQTGNGEHGDHGVAQRMPPSTRGGQALRTRRADVVLVEHLDQRRAGNAGQDRRLRQSECYGRQEQRFQCRPDTGTPARKASGRHQPQPDGKEVDQHQREPEVRHGDAELRGSPGNRHRPARPRRLAE